MTGSFFGKWFSWRLREEGVHNGHSWIKSMVSVLRTGGLSFRSLDFCIQRKGWGRQEEYGVGRRETGEGMKNEKWRVKDEEWKFYSQYRSIFKHLYKQVLRNHQNFDQNFRWLHLWVQGTQRAPFWHKDCLSHHHFAYVSIERNKKKR